MISILASRLWEIPRKIAQYQSYSVHYWEDEHKLDYTYVTICTDAFHLAMGKYMNAKMRLSANFLLDPLVKGADLMFLLTIDSHHNIISHWTGHGKIQLPGIANSSSIKYSIQEIEKGITDFVAQMNSQSGYALPGYGAGGSGGSAGSSNGVAGGSGGFWPSVVGGGGSGSGTAPVKANEEVTIRTLPRSTEPTSHCDCGAKKCGYMDREKHAHAQWCKVQQMHFMDIDNGNGD